MKGSGMTDVEPVTIEISKESDTVLAGKLTESLLASMGFDGLPVEEVTIVARELASNIVNHAGEGQVTITPLAEGGATGIEIVAEDSGPGIAEVDRAVIDGVSTTDSIGGGLGTVHRLMDEVDIDSGSQGVGGVRVTARRWIGPTPSAHSSPWIDIGGATRPMPGYDQNGDAYLIVHDRGVTLAGVIDGLGHGEAAHRATSAAERFVRTHASDSIDDLFAGVEAACQSTRGVVMALAQLDWSSRTAEVGAVGNIGIRFCHADTSERPISRRGVLGQGARKPRVETVDWQPRTVMVLHSDGIKSRWDCDELDFEAGETASDVASNLLGELAKPDDDATVLVAREAGG